MDLSVIFAIAHEIASVLARGRFETFKHRFNILLRTIIMAALMI